MIGIIGTAGRDDNPKMTKELFERMVLKCKEVIKDIGCDNPACLVSGGAAWSDHVAVELFMQGVGNKLRLHLPCPWETHVESKYSPHYKEMNSGCGTSANYYHRRFSRAMGRNTLEEIDRAREKGATIIVGNGFHDRNTNIAAESEYLIAFTWDEGVPKSGGTYDTWRKAKQAKRIHVNLNTFKTTKHY